MIIIISQPIGILLDIAGLFGLVLIFYAIRVLRKIKGQSSILRQYVVASDNLLVKNFQIRDNIPKFILSNFWKMFLSCFCFFILTFILVRFMKGGGGNYDRLFYSSDDIDEIVADWRLKESIFIQLIHAIKKILFENNWGVSFSLSPGVPLWEYAWVHITRSLEIMFFATLFSFYPTFLLYKLPNQKQKQKTRRISILFSYIISSVPVFWLSIILRTFLTPTIFPHKHYLFPQFESILQNGTITGFGLFDMLISGQDLVLVEIIKHLILPVFILFLYIFSINIQGIYNKMSLFPNIRVNEPNPHVNSFFFEEFNKKKTNKIFKESPRMICVRVMLILKQNLPLVITASLLIEKIFYINGMGEILIFSIRQREYFLIPILISFIIGLVLLIRMIYDLLIAFMDPRISPNLTFS